MKRNFFVLILVILSAAKLGAQDCATSVFSTPAYDKTNLLLLEIDLDSFPDETREDVEVAVGSGGRKWNQACGVAPPLNDQPYFVPTVKGSVPAIPGTGVGIVPVRFRSGTSPNGEPCKFDTTRICYPYATTAPGPYGGLVVTIWELAGPSDSLIHTLSQLSSVLDILFEHEFGHVLNLGHDLCPNGSIMYDGFESALGGGHQIDQAHCNKLEEMFEPPDILDQLLYYNPDNACGTILFYCDDNGGGFFTPWPKIRSRCTWVPDVTTAFFDYTDNLGHTWTSRGKTALTLRCLSIYGSLTEEEQRIPELETIAGPSLMVQSPEANTVAVNSQIWLEGWAWGRDRDIRQIRVWVDGGVIQLSNWQAGQYSPEPCAAGIDPGHCDPYSKFSGFVDVGTLSPGVHQLQVIATDMNEDPVPTSVEIPFVVPAAGPNHPPVAVSDNAIATVGVGLPLPITIPVINNDWDPDGTTPRLTQQPIITYPSKGMVSRLDDGRLQYLPLPNVSGLDSFVYEIEDGFGATSTTSVTVRIYEAIVLP